MKHGVSGFVTSLILCVVQLTMAKPVRAEDSAWREVKIVVGAGAGGGYDIYGRLVAKHLGRFLPGSPRVIIVNMPGANGMTAAAYMAANARKDGSELFLGTQPLVLSQLFKKPGVRFDLRQFHWIGNLSGSNTVTIVRTDADVADVNAARSKETTMGSASPGSLGGIYPALINNTLGTKFKVINGYNSGDAIDLALERGEVQGRSGVSWSTLKSLRQDWLRDGSIKLLVQVGLAKSLDLADTPLLLDLAKNDDDRAVIKLLSSLNAFTRAFLAPPGTPDYATSALRNAFDSMIQDKEFLQNAHEMRLEIDPMSGKEIEAAANALLDSPDHVIAQAKSYVDVE